MQGTGRNGEERDSQGFTEMTPLGSTLGPQYMLYFFSFFVLVKCCSLCTICQNASYCACSIMLLSLLLLLKFTCVYIVFSADIWL